MTEREVEIEQFLVDELKLDTAQEVKRRNERIERKEKKGRRAVDKCRKST